MNNYQRSRSLEEERDIRAQTIRADISKRLRRACSYLSDDDFASLVEKMTREQLRGEGRSSQLHS